MFRFCTSIAVLILLIFESELSASPLGLWPRRCRDLVVKSDDPKANAKRLVRALTLDHPILEEGKNDSEFHLSCVSLYSPLCHDYGGVSDLGDDIWMGYRTGDDEPTPTFVLLPRRTDDPEKKYVLWNFTSLPSERILNLSILENLPLAIEGPASKGHRKIELISHDRDLSGWSLPKSLSRFPGIYTPFSPYVFHLLKATRSAIERSERILIMGSGVGTEAVAIAGTFSRAVDATDISPIAVANTLASAERYGLSHFVNAWTSDGFGTVFDKYDLILFNAPLPLRNANNPNIADQEGALLWRLIHGLSHRLNPGGRFMLMSSPQIQKPLQTEVDIRSIYKFREQGIRFSIFEIRP